MTVATEPQAAGDGELRYAYRPSLLGAPCEFALRPEGLDWHVGRRSGLLRYDAVRSVRMSFRPVTMQSHRFITELHSAESPKLQIASVSWRSMIEQERLDAAYAAFVTELHRRLGAAGSRAQFTAGMPVVPYFIGVVVFAGVIIAAAGIFIHAVQLQQWRGAALVGAFFAIFGYQIGNYFRRNLPHSYRPDLLPVSVLPRV